MVCFSNFIFILLILLVFYGLLPVYRKVSGFNKIQMSLCYCSYLFVFMCITGLERGNFLMLLSFEQGGSARP